MKKLFSYLLTAAAALMACFTYIIFVIPNNFAPAGVNGICTIIQYLFHFNIGYISLIINVPLAIWVFFKVSKSMAFRSMVYVVVFSVGMIVLQNKSIIDLSFIEYNTANGTSRILGPTVAGIIMGWVSAILMRVSSTTGGTVFVSALIHDKHPEKSVFFITLILNVVVALSSYFVYDYQIEPVIMCIVYNFASSTTADRFLALDRKATRFEIITGHAKEITNDIINELHHSATIVESKGAYSGEEKNVIICIINNSQVPLLKDICNRYPGSFAILNTVSEVKGNFKKINKNGKQNVSMFDAGDNKN